MPRERVAAVIIKDKKILLVTNDDANFYWTPGGGVEEGETHIEALSREILEELGASMVNYSHYLTYKTVNEVRGMEQEVHCYILDISGEIKPSSEIKNIGWFAREEIPKVAIGIRNHLIPQLIEDKHI